MRKIIYNKIQMKKYILNNINVKNKREFSFQTIFIEYPIFFTSVFFILRLFYNEYKEKKKKTETQKREEKSLLSTSNYLEFEANTYILKNDLINAEKILKEVLQVRLSTFIGMNDIQIIEIKEKISKISFERGNFELSIVKSKIFNYYL
jgi:hypothetical protein